MGEKKAGPRERSARQRVEDDLDRLVAEIQQHITEQEERMYSEQVRTEASAPQNMGKLEEPDATGAYRGECGDTMVFDVKVRDGVIVDIRFRTDGCGPTMACGSRLTRLVKGRPVEEAREVSSLDLEEELGGLPDENKHCAVLAVTALGRTLDLLPDEEKGQGRGTG